MIRFLKAALLLCMAVFLFVAAANSSLAGFGETSDSMIPAAGSPSDTSAVPPRTAAPSGEAVSPISAVSSALADPADPALSADHPAAFKEPFPALYFTERYRNWIRHEDTRPHGPVTEKEEQQRILNQIRPIFLNDDILAFYGHPLSPNMGILGRYSIENLTARLDALAAEYDEVNGSRGIRTAFYLIYATVQPAGEIHYMPEAILQKYIQFALEHNMLVFIDHQIGRYDPIESLKIMLPYLRYPNVHLALDPEWRTDKPMEVIGTVAAAEINEAQRVMADYLEKNRLPGDRMLVIHQFHQAMLPDSMNIRTGRKRVTLVHCADGFGPPASKRRSYAANAQAQNMPVKGFKLFYNFEIPGAGYDDPLLTPAEVNRLNPRPCIVMYQ